MNYHYCDRCSFETTNWREILTDLDGESLCDSCWHSKRKQRKGKR